MDRDAALEKLNSPSTHERLKAARFLARNHESSFLSALTRARQVETVSYVKRSLDVAIARCANLSADGSRGQGDEPDSLREVRPERRTNAKAVEQIAGLILHELAAPIGLVKEAASHEIPEFSQSRTKARLDRIDRIFEGVQRLKEAAATPRPEGFDLSQLILEEIAAETEGKDVTVSVQGPQPFAITSDPRLLRLAICNGLRNAIEAVIGIENKDPHQVIVTWGETDIDYWIVVIDRGPGIPTPIDPAFKVGNTNKKGHSGFGLAIAHLAMESLNGTVSLHQAHDGGARFELRWEQ